MAERKGLGCGTIFLILFVVAFIGGQCDKKSSTSSIVSSTSWQQQDNSIMAHIQLQEVVKSKLKSPSSAQFPYASDPKTFIRKLPNNQYLVTSWVDSQNSFGAMLRTSYSGIIEQTDESHWRLIEFTFL